MQFRNIRDCLVGAVQRFLSGPKPGHRQAGNRLEVTVLEAREVPATLGLLVPAYAYPTPGGEWAQLAAAAPKVHITAILNPNSGPGTAADPNYVSAVNALRAAGGKVIGYVHTSYGAIPLSTVETEIKDYNSWYHLDGIFVDEMTSDGSSGHLSYYQTIDNFAHSLHSSWLVVGNPGTNVPSSYLNVADQLVLFENGSGYNSYTPPTWQTSSLSSRVANIVYNVPASSLQTDLNLAVSRHTGWIYVTDANLPNPYGTLPSYWTQLVSDVERID